MAEKRMFSMQIVDSDDFVELPASSQALYFALGMRCDDDGMINKPRSVMRLIGASQEDLDRLIKKRFLLAFDTGVVAIKHWRMNNTIRKDRYHPTQYRSEFASLRIKPNGAYTDRPIVATDTLATDTLATDTLATENREEKSRVKERSVEPAVAQKGSEAAAAPARDPNVKRPRGVHGNIVLSDYEVAKLQRKRPADWDEKLQRVDTWLHENPSRHIRDHYDTIIRWAEEDDKDVRKNIQVVDTSVHFKLENGVPENTESFFVDLFADDEPGEEEPKHA